MSDEKVVHAVIGRGAWDGKWYAEVRVPGEIPLRSPACDTEEEAEAQQEIGVKAVLEAFGPMVVNINRNYGVIQ